MGGAMKSLATKMYGGAKSTWRSGGFTLVEVLACLTFLGILIPVVVSALLVANRASVVAERSEIATQLGENHLSELMLNDEWTSASRQGDFGNDWPGYSWQLTKTDWGSGAMTEMTLDVSFMVQGAQHHVLLATLVNESVSQSQQQQ